MKYLLNWTKFSLQERTIKKLETSREEYRYDRKMTVIHTQCWSYLSILLQKSPVMSDAKRSICFVFKKNVQNKPCQIPKRMEGRLRKNEKRLKYFTLKKVTIFIQSSPCLEWFLELVLCILIKAVFRDLSWWKLNRTRRCFLLTSNSICFLCLLLPPCCKPPGM